MLWIFLVLILVVIFDKMCISPPLAEIPDFLTEDECKLIIHLAQLKGLQKSQILPTDDYEEAMEMIDISQMDIFNLLDHNQDGQLQLKEVFKREQFDTLWNILCKHWAPLPINV